MLSVTKVEVPGLAYRVITLRTPLVLPMGGRHGSETRNGSAFGWTLERIRRSRWGQVLVRVFWPAVPPPATK